MRRFLPCAILLTLFLFSPLLASDPKRTDARSYGFLGPIRSVSTIVDKENFDVPDEIGLPMVSGVWCLECAFDRDGNCVKFGKVLDGQFQGDFTRFQHGPDGQITEKIVENPQGEMHRREMFGPYGITEAEDYEDGKPVGHSLWFYDGNGHMSSFKRYHRDQRLSSSSSSLISADGNYHEQWDYGPDGNLSLHFVETTDPKTDTWTFTSFNENGSTRLSVKTVGTKVVSYWQLGDKPELGIFFAMNRIGKTQKSFSCHSDGTCDSAISYFRDETYPFEDRMERYDGAGELKVAADYEYEVDPRGNWTKQKVWVWTPKMGERKLCETDLRVLEYWEK